MYIYIIYAEIGLSHWLQTIMVLKTLITKTSSNEEENPNLKTKAVASVLEP